MIRTVAARLPYPLQVSLRRIRDAAAALPYRGTGRTCPVCGKTSSRFRSFGVIPREDAQCVYCGSLERHRFLWLFLQRRTNLFGSKARRVLHVAPERSFEPRLKASLGPGYLTADLLNPRAMVQMDVTEIQYPDASFDVVLCSHVLEHVLDDRKAMREFHRVLDDQGWAILLVPIMSDKTFEDPTITDPKERLRAFGQEDHVRLYGPDYADRLRESGFVVEVTTVRDLVTGEEAERMGLTPPSGDIFYCTKEQAV